MRSLVLLRAERAKLRDLLKGRRRTEPRWQRSDGSWWERGPDGKPRRVKTSKDANHSDPHLAHAHDRLAEIEAHLRSHGHDDHAETVAKARQSLGRKPRAARSTPEIAPINVIRDHGEAELRRRLAGHDVDTLIRIGRRGGVQMSVDHPGGGGHLLLHHSMPSRRLREKLTPEQVVDAIVKGAHHYNEMTEGAIRAGAGGWD